MVVGGPPSTAAAEAPPQPGRRAKPRSRRLRSGVLEATAVPTDPESTRAAILAGDTCLRGDDPFQAARHYAIALTALKTTGDKALLTKVYLRLGHANRALGRTLPAVQSYRSALEMSPDHPPTLEALVSLHTAWEEWSYVAKYEERLFKALCDSDTLHDVLLRSGDRWWELAEDLDRAHVRFMIAAKRFPRSQRAAERLAAVTKAMDRPPPTKRSWARVGFESGTYPRRQRRTHRIERTKKARSLG